MFHWLNRDRKYSNTYILKFNSAILTYHLKFVEKIDAIQAEVKMIVLFIGELLTPQQYIIKKSISATKVLWFQNPDYILTHADTLV